MRKEGKRMKIIVLSILAIFSTILALAFPMESFGGPYYEGKVITIIVGYKPGGGYDRMARHIAKHLPKHIPGRPAVIVQNMPGANSILAANHIYNVVKSDGFTIGTFIRGLPIAQLTKVEGIKFDMAKFSWIGSAGSEATVFAIRTDHPCKNFDDIKKAKEPVIVGATGPGDLTYDFPILLREFLGLNLKIITGYSSSADIMLAIERKEVDSRTGTYSSLKPFISRNLVRPIIRGRVSDAGIESIPVDEDLTTDKKGKTIMALRSAPDLIGRPYVAPPGTNIEVMNILREGFAKVAKDPEAIEDAKKLMMEFEFVSAEEALKTVKYILEQPPEIIKELSKYLKFGG